MLKDCCTSEELDMISEIVKMHNKRGNSNLPDIIKIVQDADILDHMGSLELWISLMYCAHEEKGPDYAVDFWNGEHYHRHISQARELLNYDISKEIYDDRLDFQTKYIERFSIESNGGVFK